MENTDYKIPKGKEVVFVGRFQPLHRGHLEAIKWILAQSKRLKIVIGSMQEFGQADNPLEFADRKRILELALAEAGVKNCEMCGLPDFYNDAAWTQKMLEITGLKAGETVLVSLNDWAKSCAKKIGIEAADQPVFCGNLSATQVRQTIFAGANWKNLVPPAVFDCLQNEGLAQKIADCQIPPEDKIVEFVKRQMEAAGLERAALGVSGGIDSAVMAAILGRALGKKATFVWMPFVRNCPFG